MARRKNALDEGELAIVSKKTKAYVETFEDAINLFLKDCEIHNLKPHTLKFYRGEINTFLSYLAEQEIDVAALKPYQITAEHIKENVILYLRKLSVINESEKRFGNNSQSRRLFIFYAAVSKSCKFETVRKNIVFLYHFSVLSVLKLVYS